MVTVRGLSMFWWLSWLWGLGPGVAEAWSAVSSLGCSSGGRCGQSQAYEEVGKGNHVIASGGQERGPKGYSDPWP